MLIHYCYCVCASMRNTETCVAHVWTSEDNSIELVVSFHLYMGPGDQTQVSKLVQQMPLPS